MRYMLTLWGDESAWAGATSEQIAEEMGSYDAFTREVREAGALISGEGLDPTPTAKTLRVRGDVRDVTDGPFAETREQLGGFYVLECGDIDEAIAWAAKLPAAATGGVEVRPVMEFERPS
jgi:hypothetical protein